MNRPLHKLNDAMQTVMREACRRVGADPEVIDFGDDDWYMDYSWTQAESDAFETWFADLLYTDASVRKALMTVPRRNKKIYQQCAGFWS